MKLKQISFLLIMIGLFYSPITANAKKPKSKTGSPKIEKAEMCYVLGFLEERREGETMFYICRLVSTAKCVSIPCNVWGPYGPQNKAAVQQGTLPPELGIQPGSNYIVKYNQDGGTTVQYVNQIQVEESPDQIAIHFN